MVVQLHVLWGRTVVGYRESADQLPAFARKLMIFLAISANIKSRKKTQTHECANKQKVPFTNSRLLTGSDAYAVFFN